MNAPLAKVMVPASEQCLYVARSLEDMAEGLAMLKNMLGLSDTLCDQLGGLAAGTTNKHLGPSQFKSLGKVSLPILNGVLAAEWRLYIDVEQLRLMERRWEARQLQYVQPLSRPPSQQIIDRAKPHILEASGRHANAVRNRMLTPEQRSKIARKAARARWRKRRKTAREAAE